MKSPFDQGMLLALFTGMLLCISIPSVLEARIGESKGSIESRLLSSGGIVYRDDTIKANRRRGMPYLKYFEYLENSAVLRIYFKTADGRRPMASQLKEKRMLGGWDLHVVYVNGKSEIEIYKRSEKLTDYELNQLLSVQAGDSYWKRVSDTEKAETESAFGYSLVRDDGLIRAKVIGGDSVMFVKAHLDIQLAQKDTAVLQSEAPVSVRGF